jgi:hypothetical protein
MARRRIKMDTTNSVEELLRIEEAAKNDPIWRKVLEHEERIPQIKMLLFSGRITETRVFIDWLLSLHSDNKEKLLRQMMEGVPELVSNPRYVNVNRETDRGIIDFMIAKMERSTSEKIERYRVWIINQALVMFCTILDTFLEHLLDTIFRCHEKLLYGLAAEKTVDLKRLIELGSVPAAIAEVRTKEIKAFSYEDIGRRLRYVHTKLKIETGKVFNWEDRTPELQSKLAGWDLKRLEESYERRHSIVHRDETPVADKSELDTIAEFFTHVILNLSFLATKEHNLALDVAVLANRPTLYARFKEEASSQK